jgi:biopolymer transport protein ExbD
LLPDTQVFFQKIVGEARKQPQPEFHIRADKEARWEGIGRVIFNLQRGGIVKVGFITEPDRGSIRVTR